MPFEFNADARQRIERAVRRDAKRKKLTISTQGLDGFVRILERRVDRWIEDGKYPDVDYTERDKRFRRVIRAIDKLDEVFDYAGQLGEFEDHGEVYRPLEEYNFLGNWREASWRSELIQIREQLEDHIAINKAHPLNPKNRPIDRRKRRLHQIVGRTLSRCGVRVTTHRDGVAATVLRVVCEAALGEAPKDPLRILKRIQKQLVSDAKHEERMRQLRNEKQK